MLPANVKAMTLPQRLICRSARSPPRSATLGRRLVCAAQIHDLLVAVGLPALAGRLEEEAHWNRMLSLGEQQRIAIARAILHAPDYLLLDEATASLDEPAEAALYQLLHERLPGAAIISIGHRSTLEAFHSGGSRSRATAITIR